MRYDLIALDLDGTALDPRNEVSPGVRQAVLWARERGVRVVVSTGRICGEAADFARLLGCDDEMVTAGGASLSSVSRGECLTRDSMPWEVAVRAAACCERLGLSTMVYMGTRLYMTPHDEASFALYKSNEGYLAAKTVVPSVAELIGREHLPVDKVFTRSLSPVNLALVRERASGIEGLRVISSASDNLELMPVGVDKGRALHALCARCGTTPDRAIAIGDSENDLEMLAAAGMPVAMGNATEAVKAIAKHHTGTNAEDGVAQAIYALLGA